MGSSVARNIWDLMGAMGALMVIIGVMEPGASGPPAPAPVVAVQPAEPLSLLLLQAQSQMPSPSRVIPTGRIHLTQAEAPITRPERIPDSEPRPDPPQDAAEDSAPLPAPGPDPFFEPPAPSSPSYRTPEPICTPSREEVLRQFRSDIMAMRGSLNRPDVWRRELGPGFRAVYDAAIRLENGVQRGPILNLYDLRPPADYVRYITKRNLERDRGCASGTCRVPGQ